MEIKTIHAPRYLSGWFDKEVDKELEKVWILIERGLQVKIRSENEKGIIFIAEPAKPDETPEGYFELGQDMLDLINENRGTSSAKDFLETVIMIGIQEIKRYKEHINELLDEILYEIPKEQETEDGEV